MEARSCIVLSAFLIPFLLGTACAQLRTDFYKGTCPNVESLVTSAVKTKFQQTFVTAPATLRLFFHDCFVRVSSQSRSNSNFRFWYNCFSSSAFQPSWCVVNFNLMYWIYCYRVVMLRCWFNHRRIRRRRIIPITFRSLEMDLTQWSKPRQRLIVTLTAETKFHAQIFLLWQLEML